MTKKIQSNPGIPSARSEDQPATRKIVTLVRDELKSEIRTLDRKMDSQFEKVNAELTGMKILLEEQTSNNRIVLEGLQALWQRQERIEDRLDKARIS